jgi:DMSO/TMAO reductase YedYZ molybdopterin-dependent catalytic subunit
LDTELRQVDAHMLIPPGSPAGAPRSDRNGWVEAKRGTLAALTHDEERMRRTTSLFVVMAITLAFLVTAVSGLVLYIPGQLLPVFHGSLLGWRSIHDWSAVVLTAAVVVHVALNRRRVVEMLSRLLRPAGSAQTTVATTPGQANGSMQDLGTGVEATHNLGMGSKAAPATGHRPRFTRRRFLVLVGGAVAAAIAALSLDRGGSTGAGASSGKSSLANFPVLNVENGPPEGAAAAWVVEVDGLVENKVRLDRAAWLALPRTQETRDFHCVEGWSVGNLGWEGVRVAELLSLAKPQATGQFVSFHAYSTTYLDTLTLAEAQAPETLLADRLDGAPLPTEHGGPLRLVIPSQLGYKNVKWVVRLEVTQTRAVGYWEQGGAYPAEAPVASSGRSGGTAAGRSGAIGPFASSSLPARRVQMSSA